jgi:hypothetical protein
MNEPASAARYTQTTWPAGDRIGGTESFFAAQAGLTVRTILTPQADSMTCWRDDSLSEIVPPDLEFEFLPVEEALGEYETIIVGLRHTRALVPDADLRVEQRMISLDERHVIGDTMSILDFLRLSRAANVRPAQPFADLCGARAASRPRRS